MNSFAKKIGGSRVRCGGRISVQFFSLLWSFPENLYQIIGKQPPPPTSVVGAPLILDQPLKTN